jgi:hypothetical protein
LSEALKRLRMDLQKLCCLVEVQCGDWALQGVRRWLCDDREPLFGERLRTDRCVAAVARWWCGRHMRCRSLWACRCFPMSAWRAVDSRLTTLEAQHNLLPMISSGNPSRRLSGHSAASDIASAGSRGPCTVSTDDRNCRVDLVLDCLAVAQEGVEVFCVVQQQAVIDHAAVVVG